MNFKTFVTAIFAVVLLLSTASAMTLSQIGSATIPANVSTSATSLQVTYTLNNTGVDGTFALSTSGLTLSTTTPNNFTLVANESKTYTSTFTFSAGSSNIVGSLTADPVGSGSAVTVATLNVPRVSSVNFCKSGEKGGNLSISNVDINSDGDDDETWRPLDKIKIEVDVENNADDDIDDVMVEIGLFDSTGRNQIGDLDFTSKDEEEYDVGDIKDGDEETATFEFVVPADIEDGNYQLKIKAYSDDLGESVECTDTASDFSDFTFQDIEIELENDEDKFIIFDNVEFNPTEATCGDVVTLAFDTYNVGTDDEDRVNVHAESKDLKFDMNYEITNGLDQGDKEPVLFTFTVPQGLADRYYKIDLWAESQYDDRDGSYDEESADVDSQSIKIFGCGIGSGSSGSNSGSSNQAAISASLDSAAKAGEELVVTTTIANRLSTEESFVISASGYNSWATLKSVSDRIVTLGAGESTEVTLTFVVDKDAEGEQSFVIEATNGESVSEREVVVELEASTGFSLGDNGLFWGIAIVNIVLLIAIVLVAIRLSRN